MKFKLIPGPERKVTVKMTIIDNKNIQYDCPECGQKVEAGINGNKKMKISYRSPQKTRTDHSHIYPTYVDTEWFEKMGIPFNPFDVAKSIKKQKEKIIRRLK